MAPDQDLSFDKLGVRTDGGHISDVNRFPACKYRPGKTRQTKLKKPSQSRLQAFDPPKPSNSLGLAGLRALKYMQTNLTAGGLLVLEVRGQVSNFSR